MKNSQNKNQAKKQGHPRKIKTLTVSLSLQHRDDFFDRKLPTFLDRLGRDGQRSELSRTSRTGAAMDDHRWQISAVDLVHFFFFLPDGVQKVHQFRRRAPALIPTGFAQLQMHQLSSFLLIRFLPMQMRHRKRRRRRFQSDEFHVDFSVTLRTGLRPINRERIFASDARFVELTYGHDRLNLFLRYHVPKIVDRFRERRLSQDESTISLRRVNIAEK